MNITYKSFRKLGGLLGLALLFTVSSCDEDEYLQKIPPTQISAADAFSTPARIEGLVNGIYSSLKGANFYGGRLHLFRDAAGEDFINTGGNSFTGFDAWNHSYNSGAADILNVWSVGYTTINRANILIDGLAQNTGVIDAAVASEYVAEAKFLRALSYFTLVTAYAQPYNKDNGGSPGLPLRLQAETTPANNDLARSTVAQVYTQIIQDLNDAETALPTTRSTALLNTTRAHKNAAIALKARVYLNQGDYAKVIEEAAKIVPQAAAPFSATSGVAHALQSNIVNLFATNYTTTESVFSMPFTSLDMLAGQSALGYMYVATPDYCLNWDEIFAEPQWASTDARRGFLNHNANLDAAKGGRYYLNKFGTAAPFLRYVPVIRYSEVLLNYAEAAARAGGASNLALAEELLKAVHGRSDADYTFPALDQAGLIDAILIERRIELLGEGFRANDILRLVTPFPAKAGTVYTTPTVQPNAPNYIWPMSNDELLNNKLIN
ncbi:MAG: RagB/SusD family nutrient uptake outer membrane protein [Cyclobacteriaceae bacterium]|nr:RagB/SusD family nutrient uptake outer membrane protein [Cyclobacteriaceae bacterium]